LTSTVLTQRQLNRSLLARQLLLERVRMPALEVIHRLVGMQAQEPIDPYVGLWTRVEGFDPDELSQLLESRAAVRAVALMRTTIHLVTAKDALAIRPLMQPALERLWRTSGFAKRIGDADVDEVVAAGVQTLAQGPLIASELGRRLRERWPEADGQSLGYAVRFLVPNIQPPPRGLWRRRGAALVQLMETWLGRPVDTEPPLDELVMRYLAAFGPATPADVSAWSGWTAMRDALDRLRPRLRTFRDERGRELFDVPDAPFPDPDTPVPVRFLPQFDNIALGHEDRSRVIGRRYSEPIWLRGGILVDGMVRGTWKLDTKGEDAQLLVRIFEPMSEPEVDDVGEEAIRLGSFLAPNSSVGIEIERLAP
jgi:hypothetical protein